jgi:sporulation protein YlmC with PRC-barrel domain
VSTGWRRILGERTSVDAVLHLLDRQVVDSDGRMAGKVDDLELVEDDDGRLTVSALLTGPGALGPRLGGAVGAVATATWSRLSGRPEDRPGRIDLGLVADVGTVVTLSVRRSEVDTQGFEAWVRTRVIEALPGAGAAADVDERVMAAQDGRPGDDGGTPGGAGRVGGAGGSSGAGELGGAGGAARPRVPRRGRLSRMLGMRLVGAGPEHGRHAQVLDVVLEPDGDDRLAATGLVVGRRAPGTLFGYHRHPDQGPWLIRTLVLALHRHTRTVPWTGVIAVDWDASVVRLGEGAGGGSP